MKNEKVLKNNIYPRTAFFVNIIDLFNYISKKISSLLK